MVRMARELIRLRELIGCEVKGATLLYGDHSTGHARVAVPVQEYIRCRALLDAEKGETK